MKRCGKSAPRGWRQTRHAKPHAEQDQIGRRLRAARPKSPGRLLDPASNAGARGMVVVHCRSVQAERRWEQNSAYRLTATLYVPASRPSHEQTAGEGNPELMASFLVTGGAGFIGSHLVEELLRRGHRVRAADSLITGKRENLAERSMSIC